MDNMSKVSIEQIVFVISKYQLEGVMLTMIPVKSKRIVELIWSFSHMKLNVEAADLHLIQQLSIITDSFSCGLMKKS